MQTEFPEIGAAAADDAVRDADSVIARLAASRDPALCEHLYAAWLRKAGALRSGDARAQAEALRALDALLAHAGDEPPAALWPQVAAALASKAERLFAAGEPVAAIAAGRALRARFGDSPRAELRACLAAAEQTLLEGCAGLGEIARVDAVREAGQAVERYGDDRDPATRLAAARLALRLGDVLEAMDYLRAAVETWRALRARLAGATDPRLREIDARALLWIARRQWMDADQARQALDPAEDENGRENGAGHDHPQEHPQEHGRDRTPGALVESSAPPAGSAAFAQAPAGEDEDDDAQRYRQAQASVEDLLARFGADTDPALRAICLDAERLRIGILRHRGDLAAALAAYQALIDRHRDDPGPALRANLAGLGLERLRLLAEQGAPETVLAACEDFAAERIDALDPQVLYPVLRALALKRQALVELRRLDEAERVFAPALDRHQAHPDPQLRLFLAANLLDFARGPAVPGERQLAVYDELLRRFGDAPAHPAATGETDAARHDSAEPSAPGEEDEDELHVLIASVRVSRQGALIGLHRYAEAVEQADATIARYAGESGPQIQRLVLAAMNDKALALQHQGRTEAMRESYRAVVARVDLSNASAELREAAALARYRLVRSALEEDNDPEAARRMAEALAQAHGDDPHPPVRLQVAHAWHSLAYWLTHHDQAEAALGLYAQVLAATAADADRADVRLTRLTTLRNRASALFHLGRTQEAVAVLDELAAQAGRDASLEERNLLANAQEQRALYLIQLRSRGEAPPDAPGDAHGPEFDAAFALIDEGDGLSAQGDYAGAHARYDQVIVRHADAGHRDLRFLHALALHQKCLDLSAQKRYSAVLAVASEMLARHGEERSSRFSTLVGRVLLDQAGALGKLGRKDEAADAYAGIALRYRDHGNEALRDHASLALYNRAVMIDGSAAPEAVLAAYAEAVDYGIAAASVAMQLRAAKASVNLATELEALGRPQEQAEVCQRGIAQWGATRDPELRKRVARLLELQAQACARLGRGADAVAACERLNQDYADLLDAAQRRRIAALQKAHRPGLLGRLFGRGG